MQCEGFAGLFIVTLICVFILSNQAGTEYECLGDNNMKIKIALYGNRDVMHNGFNGWKEGRRILKEEIK